MLHGHKIKIIYCLPLLKEKYQLGTVDVAEPVSSERYRPIVS